jgi:hypothetical protein
MPIRWYGPADPADPTYCHYERVVNLCLHGGLFAAVNTGLWFVQGLRHPWVHLSWLSLTWGVLWLLHLIIVLRLRPRTQPLDQGEV